MSQSGWTVLDVEALIREVFEILKTKVKAEGGSTMESRTRRSEDGDEDTSLSTKDGAYEEAEERWWSLTGEVGVDTEAEAGYDDTTREGCGASHPLVMWRKEG